MATNWSQTGQYAGSGQYGSGPGPGQTAQGYERPPVCFTCGQEGHFVVDCPKSSNRSSSAGLSGTPRPQHSAGPGYGSQPAQYNSQSSSAVIPQYSPSHNAAHHQHYDHPAPGPPVQSQPGNYMPPGPPQQYQQYSAQPQQGYPPQVQQTSYQQQQPYNGQPQAYNQAYPQTGPAPPQYGYQGYQGPSQGGFAQYPQPPAPQQYNGPPYQPAPQQYPHPAVPYSPHPESYPPQPNGYDQGFNYASPAGPQQGPPQWNSAPPPVPSYNPSPYQNPSQPSQPPNYLGQYGHPNQGQYSQPQVPPAYEVNNYSYQQPPPETNYTYPPYQQGQSYEYQGAPANHDYPQPRSRSSSFASIPYASRRGSLASSQDKPIPIKDELTEASSRQFLARQSPEDQEFNWEYKKAFQDNAYQPAMSMKRPFPVIFEDDTTALFANNSTDTVSRYVSKNHQKEFKQNIRSTHHWNSIQRDPAFSEWSDEDIVIPIEQLSTWNETFQRKSSCRSKSTSPSRKRGRDDEQGNFRNLVGEAASSLDPNRVSHAKRHKATQGSSPVKTVRDDRQRTPTLQPGTPVLGTLGSPSLEAADDAWAPQAGEGVDPTEARLAALGVSGAPKPVEPMDPVLLPEDFHRPSGSKYPPQRQDSGYISSRGSYSNGSESNTHKNNYNHGQGQWHTPPPPPPPPPPLSRRLDGTNESPPSLDCQLQDLAPEQTINGMTQSNSPLTPISSENIPQEPQPRRKIVRVISGKKSEPQRQADDVTPKFKRNQPVVAEAYSRRW